MTRPLPDVSDPEFAEHWAGLREREIRVRRCRSCTRATWPPRAACPHCQSMDLDWTPAASTGTVYSYTLVGHQTVAGMPPGYAVLLVELDDPQGVRVVGGFDGDPSTLRVGLSVTATFDTLSDEVALLTWVARPHASTDKEDA